MRNTSLKINNVHTFHNRREGNNELLIEKSLFVPNIISHVIKITRKFVINRQT